MANLRDYAHILDGVDSKAKKVLSDVFDRWFPSAVMSLTNKTISSCTINNNVTGNLTGDVEGDVTGDLTGNVTGNVEGNVTGNVTGEVTALGSAETAEHGAGAIGTGVAPKTYRYNLPNGDICTEIQIDLTGLGVKGDAADDVIGLVTEAPDAYIGKIVTATYGVVYKVELICLETPAGTDTTADINITLNSGGELGYDEAASNDYLFNTGGLAIGSLYQNILPTTITTNDYIYMTEGDTTASEGTYTAGQFILRFYGHAILS